MAESALFIASGTAQPDTARLSARAALLIIGFGAVLLLTGLGGNRVLTYHETLMAQPAREMVATGHWIIPTNAGVPVPHKPPLMHWAIALMIKCFGPGEFFVRLPSVFSALLVTLIVAGLAARMLGEMLAIWTGLIQLTSIYVLMQSRLAEADMLLGATVAVAIYAFALMVIEPDERRFERWLPLLFYGSSGLAFLTKGPVGLAMVFPPCLVFAVWQRERRYMRFLFDIPALLVFSFLVLAWPLAAYHAYPGILKDWLQDNVGRFRGSMGGASVWFYFYTVLWLILPWTPFTIIGACSAASVRHGPKPLWRLLSLWFLIGFLVLTMSSFKHKHYLVPILPPLSVFAAKGLKDFLDWRGTPDRRRFIVEAVTTIVCAAIGSVAVAFFLPAPVGDEAALLVGVLAAGLLAALGLEWHQANNAALTTIFVTTLALELAALNLILPHYDSYRDQALFARRVSSELPGKAPLYLVGLPESQIVYYLSLPLARLVRVDDINQLPGKLRGLDPAFFIVAPAAYRTRLSQLGEVEVLDRCAVLRPHMDEGGRPTLMRLNRSASAPPANSLGDERADKAVRFLFRGAGV